MADAPAARAEKQGQVVERPQLQLTDALIKIASEQQWRIFALSSRCYRLTAGVTVLALEENTRWVGFLLRLAVWGCYSVVLGFA
jgi:hypothetical protein